jgi:ribose/xylose/arabinose/galactoside ABC-type transport system permease subunit
MSASTALRPEPRQLITGLVILAVLAILWFEAPSFFRLNNGINILVQSSTLAILAVAMAIVMIGGGIDLSLPANMAFSAIIGGFYLASGGSIPLGVLIMVLTGAAVGLVNGLAVAFLRMIPFVVTLATMTVVSGLSVWLTSSVSVSGFPEPFFDFFLSRPLGVPLAVYIAALVVAIAAIMLSSSVFGRHVFAIGISEKAARVARVPIRLTLLLSYVAAGALAGLTGALLAARLGAASANMGTDAVVLDIVSAVVVGGVSIYGGKGGALGAALGAIFITLISNALNQLGASFYVALVIKGVVIIGFIALETAGRRR